PHDQRLAVIAGLQGRNENLTRRKLEERSPLPLSDRRPRQQRLPEPGGETRGFRRVRLAVRPQDEAESSRALLISAIVRAPMIVHRPGIDLLAGFDFLAPDVRVGLRI